jgi:hypothetical protein
MAVYTNNLVIHTGTDFEQVFVLADESGPFELNGYTGIAKMKRTGSSSASTSFTTTVTDISNGKVKIALTSTQTRDLTPGRYLYDLILYSNGNSIKVLEGEVFVKKSVTR